MGGVGTLGLGVAGAPTGRISPPHHLLLCGRFSRPCPPSPSSPRLASPRLPTSLHCFPTTHSPPFPPPRLKYSLAFAFPPPRPRSHHLASRLQWGASCPSRRGRVSSRPTTPPRSPPTTPQIPVSPTAAIAALLNPNPPSPHHHRSCFLI